MGDDAILQARRGFADELRLVAKASDDKVVEAFASVLDRLLCGYPVPRT